MADIQKKLTAKIISIKPTLKSGVDHTITVEFNDDPQNEPWQQSWDIVADHPITMEEFIVSLRTKTIQRPPGLLKYLHQEINKPFEFEIK